MVWLETNFVLQFVTLSKRLKANVKDVRAAWASKSYKHWVFKTTFINRLCFN